MSIPSLQDLANEAQTLATGKIIPIIPAPTETAAEYEVARQMQTARRDAGLTQADLARRMHTTQSVVSRIESGVNVSIETLARFAEACGNRLRVQMVRESGVR